VRPSRYQACKPSRSQAGKRRAPHQFRTRKDRSETQQTRSNVPNLRGINAGKSLSRRSQRSGLRVDSCRADRVPKRSDAPNATDGGLRSRQRAGTRSFVKRRVGWPNCPRWGDGDISGAPPPRATTSARPAINGNEHEHPDFGHACCRVCARRKHPVRRPRRLSYGLGGGF